MNSKILIIGCGNSSLSSDLYDLGFENITSIDYSSVVIENMKLENTNRPKMCWLVMDMTALSFSEEEDKFDVVIDKGAMDAIMSEEGTDPWSPNPSVISSAHRMCQSVRSVMKPSTGQFIQLSFKQPHFQSKYLFGLRVRKDIVKYIVENEVENKDVVDNEGATVAVDGINLFTAETGYCETYDWNVSFSIVEQEGGSLPFFLFRLVAGDK